MKRKMITLIVSIVALVAVAATVGVSFALWEAEPSEYAYVVKTQSYVNIDIADISVDNGKLKPKSDTSAATPVVSSIVLDIQDYSCKLTFSVTKVQYLDKRFGNEWKDVPNGVLDIIFTNEDGAKIGDKTPPFGIGRQTFKIKVSLLPHMDFIDPIYKDTQFKFSVRINASAIV